MVSRGEEKQRAGRPEPSPMVTQMENEFMGKSPVPLGEKTMRTHQSQSSISMEYGKLEDQEKLRGNQLYEPHKHKHT